MRILGICGSLRKGSFNSRLLTAVRPLAPAGMTIEVFDRLGDLPLYNEDLDSRDGGPAAVQAWRDAVRQADGLLIVTPEYNSSIPGVLKNAVDWVSRPVRDAALHGKCAVTMVATTGGGLGRNVLADLGRVLHDCHAHVISGPWVVLTEAQSKLVDVEDEQGQFVPTVSDPFALMIAKVQLEALAAAVDAGAGEHAVAPLRAFFAAMPPRRPRQ